jgi:hypothetical protein
MLRAAGATNADALPARVNSGMAHLLTLMVLHKAAGAQRQWRVILKISVLSLMIA